MDSMRALLGSSWSTARRISSAPKCRFSLGNVPRFLFSSFFFGRPDLIRLTYVKAPFTRHRIDKSDLAETMAETKWGGAMPGGC
ncbi:hypothetical protein MTO96_038632 [Rhipicephalus appendiculatus]